MARLGDVPALDLSAALVVLIVNIVLPGGGTFIGAVVGKHPMLGRALAQFLLAILIIGWIWALVTSIQCLRSVKPAPAAQATPVAPGPGATRPARAQPAESE